MCWGPHSKGVSTCLLILPSEPAPVARSLAGLWLFFCRCAFRLSFSTPPQQQNRRWGWDGHLSSFNELLIYFCHYSIKKMVGPALLFFLSQISPVPCCTSHDLLISNLTLLVRSFFRNGFRYKIYRLRNQNVTAWRVNCAFWMDSWNQ